MFVLFNKIIMNNKKYNQKISQIIFISSNYKTHRHQLQTIKPVVQSFDKRRNESIKKIANQKLRYRKAVRDLGNTLLNRENDKLVTRIASITNQNRTRGQSHFSIFKHQDIQTLKQNKSNKRLSSASSSKSFNSVSSNIRSRTLRQKQIEQENIKIAKRIAHPRIDRTLVVSQLNKSYQKGQQVVSTRSRFSDKNQEIMRTLALQGLKFDRKDVQYLPQLVQKKKAGGFLNSSSQQHI